MISVIIPAYNASKTINRCIDSILNQSFTDYEILVINDESTDDTKKIVLAYNNPKILLFDKKNIHAGAVDAYMFGLKMAKGEYIYMIDSDDYIGKDYLKSLYDKMIEYDVDLVASGYRSVGDHTLEYKNSLSSGIHEANSFNIICNKAYNNQFALSPVRWNKLYKHAIINKFYYELNPRLIQREDNVFTYFYLQRCKTIFVDNENLEYNYVIDNLSVTRKKDLEFFNKMKESTYYLLSKSNNKIECARLMLDNVTNTISKSINDGVTYKELKPSIKAMVRDELVRLALKEKKLYSKKERAMMYLIRHKHCHLLYNVVKFLKKIR